MADRSALAFAAGTVAAFNALQGADCQIWINDERTIATALDELICRLGGWWKMTPSGQVELGRLDFAAPAVTFGAHQLERISRKRIVMPTRRRGVGYARNNKVHNESEIAGIILAGDIDGLGDLAYLSNVDWALVTGAGRPDTGATRNIDAGNMIRDPITGADWSLIGPVILEVTGGGGPIHDRWRARLEDGCYVAFGPNSIAAIRDRFPVSPGETMHAAWYGYRAAGAGVAQFLLNAYDASGAYLATVAVPNTVLGMDVGGAWVRRVGKIVIPAGWAFVWPHVGYNTGGTGYLYAAYPYWGKTAPGADITGENTALNTTNVAGQTAAALVADAATAKAGAASALSSISIIVSDGYLSRAEKPAVVQEWVAIFNESSVIAARATALALASHATYTTYSAAYIALSSYLGGLSPAYDNVAADTPIVAATFRGKFTDYYYARQMLLDLFTATVKATADSKTRNVHVGVWDDVAIGFPFTIGEEVERYGSSWTVTANHTKTAINGPPLPPATSNSLWAVRTKAGADGENGLSAFGVTPSLTAWIVPCDSAGVPLAGAFDGATGRLQCSYAGVDVTASCTFESLTHTAADGSIDSDGDYVVSDIGALVGKLVFRVTYDPPGAAPVEQKSCVIPVSKSIRGSAAIEVADNDVVRPTSSNMVVSDELIIPAGPGGSINISGTMGFFGTGGGTSANVQMKAQKRLAGTGDPYVDVTGYVTGSLPSLKDGEGIWNGGSAAYSTSVAGPGAQEFWQLRLVASPVGSLSAGGFVGNFKVSRAS